MLERSRWGWFLSLASFSALFLGMCWLAPHVTIHVQVAYALAFMLVGASIVLTSRYVHVESPGMMVLTLFVSAALLSIWRGAAVSILGCGCVGVLLLAAAAQLGASLGARIEKPGHLMAVAAISTVADLWSVYDPNGISARMAEKAAQAPDKIVLFAVPWPMLGTPFIAPIIGAGDILFTALYLATFERHGLSLKRGSIALLLGYALGLAAILTTERPVPLLPLLGAAILLSDRRTASLEPRERRTVWLVVAVLAAVLIVRFLR
jgi:hypothetical protein